MVISPLIQNWLLTLFAVTTVAGALPQSDGGNEPATTETTGKGAELQKVDPGPWGNLDYFELILEPPSDSLDDSPLREAHLQGTVWSFHRQTPREVEAALEKAGLGPETVQELLNRGIIDSSSGQIDLRPLDETVQSLSAEKRGILYAQFGNRNGDDPFANPFFIEPGGFAAMAVDSELPPELVNLIDSLSYIREGVLSFSDIALALKQLPDEKGRRTLLSNLLRQRSLAVRLRLDSSSDLNGISDYWTVSRRHKGILPLLESVAANSDLPSLDLVHLLPTTPRKLLNTFPRPLMSLGQSFPDCYWSALNFFSDEPSDRYLDTAKLGAWLDDQYEEVESPTQFGDIILFVENDTGKPMHACNQIAADIVFTKNGESLMKPWVLQTLDEVSGLYLKGKNVSMKYYRKHP